MRVREINRNTHVLEVKHTTRKKDISIGLFSDIHWDNPKCDRVQLKRDLDYCLKNEHRIHLNGDTFCLMQGKYDPRKAKGSILPEHNVNNYLDAVVETAIKFFKPYAHLIDVVGYGNHETNIIKRLETDPLQRFVDGLNVGLEDEDKVYTGGYGGWYIVKFRHSSYKIRYFHGSGGGGVVTRGEINLTRALQFYEGFDAYIMGHVHENKESIIVRDAIDHRFKQIDREILLLITGTYKEEYDGGYMGWHVERGAPPKAVGCRILNLEYNEPSKGGGTIKARSRKF
jgi:hypothetical protein